jgi:hypothetical protein
LPLARERSPHSRRARLAPADADTASTAVIVSEAFVRQDLKDGNALGRRLRFALEQDRAASSVAMQRLDYRSIAPYDTSRIEVLRPGRAHMGEQTEPALWS